MALADEAMANCEAHLAATNAFNTEIESYLVRYLLVLICSEFEEAVETLVEKRAASAGDPQVAAFVRSAASQLFRRLRTSDLAGLLGRFANEPREAFSATIKDSPAQVSFDTIVNNRLQVGHTTANIQLTLPELKQRYEESKPIIAEFAIALGVAFP